VAADIKLPDALLDYVVQSAEIQFASGQSWADTRPYNWQCIRALAYLYAHADTPLRESGAVADAIRDVYRAIREHPEPPDNRLTGHLADARELLNQAGAGDLIAGVDDVLVAGAEVLAEKLRSYRCLTHFTSGNCGTSTNHVAVYGCSGYRVGMVLGREDWTALARDTWDRLVADQDPDGYWAETTGGPTTLYNNLTYCCAGRMARWTGDPGFRRAAQRGAKFHRRFSYPDGCGVETIDGRCRYSPVPQVWGGFVQSETPEGRAYVARKLETIFRRDPPGPLGTHRGERCSLMCEDHQHWVPGPVGDLELDRQHYVETLTVPGAVRRNGPWYVVMQGIAHLPRGWGGFTIDRTSLFSLWHERVALIVNGSGEPGGHPAQSFRFNTGNERIEYAVPERARVDMGRPGTDEPARLTAEYRGGTCRLEAHFLSDEELRLDVSVGTRIEHYPIPFTLQLELRDGDRGNETELGEQPLELSDEDLRGKVDAGRFVVTFPRQGARLIWPRDPYNPYDVKDKKSPRGKYVTLLTLPVGADGVSVRFRVPTAARSD